LDEIISLSQDLGLNSLPQDPLKFASETMVLPTQEKTTGIRVDFIFSFTPYESQAIRRARKIFLRHQAVCFAALESTDLLSTFSDLGNEFSKGGS